MNFERAKVHYPDGRIVVLTPQEFYAIPLGERIELLTGGRLRFEKDNRPISPIDALKRA
jgi:hypothetical protein